MIDYHQRNQERCSIGFKGKRWIGRLKKGSIGWERELDWRKMNRLIWENCCQKFWGIAWSKEEGLGNMIGFERERRGVDFREWVQRKNGFRAWVQRDRVNWFFFFFYLKLVLLKNNVFFSKFRSQKWKSTAHFFHSRCIYW